jgi:hypothetical protein
MVNYCGIIVDLNAAKLVFDREAWVVTVVLEKGHVSFSCRLCKYHGHSLCLLRSHPMEGLIVALL